jgi:hypothetical protein
MSLTPAQLLRRFRETGSRTKKVWFSNDFFWRVSPGNSHLEFPFISSSGETTAELATSAIKGNKRPGRIALWGTFIRRWRWKTTASMKKSNQH